MGEVGKFLQKSTDYAATTGFHGRCSKKQSREYYEEDVLPEAERQREIDREWEAKLAKHRALEEQLEHEHAEAEASSKAKKEGVGAEGDDAENAEGADQE
jgi:predicted AAA+ superfamily ATPase